jgi:hypothetical protein
MRPTPPKPARSTLTPWLLLALWLVGWNAWVLTTFDFDPPANPQSQPAVREEMLHTRVTIGIAIALPLLLLVTPRARSLAVGATLPLSGAAMVGPFVLAFVMIFNVGGPSEPPWEMFWVVLPAFGTFATAVWAWTRLRRWEALVPLLGIGLAVVVPGAYFVML